ncbi:Fic family protein [Haliscomenobacter sp.]|uniref:Fic family protein n=1 Tax=Haliscomenobacter sp. TaxID=2717303 RepID=UPI003364E99D
MEKNHLRYIHQLQDWPEFYWDIDVLLPKLSALRHLQGVLIGRMSMLGFELKQEALLDTLTLDVIKSSEIEGEFLNPELVRSSIARHLGMDIGGLLPADRNIDGVVEMILDSTQNAQAPLSAERLFDWHAGLFPTGRSGMYKINVAQWRKDETGPMQVVSGALGREQIHFQAPEAARLVAEMEGFINWFNRDSSVDSVLKAGVAHLWFVTIHPFDDGNGRIARAIADLQLSRSEGTAARFYSMSGQIRLQRKSYYAILEKTQKGSLDISAWLDWFLDCLLAALQSAELVLEKVLFKARFWEKHSTTLLNERQILMLNKLLGDFEGKLTSSKWAKMTKCSPDSALRDIQDLLYKNILQKAAAGGRSSSYQLLGG